MGRIFVVELEGRAYGCKFCKTQLALADDLLSRAFHCRRGKAYLFKKVVNVTTGHQEERTMLSGSHTVADIFCCCCGQIVGWKYVLSLCVFECKFRWIFTSWLCIILLLLLRLMTMHPPTGIFFPRKQHRREVKSIRKGNLFLREGGSLRILSSASVLVVA